MQRSFNKGIFWGFSTIIFIVFAIIIGCNKSVHFEDDFPKPNLPLTVHSSELVDIRATDVFTTNDSLQRKIEIIERSNNTILDIFYITLKNSNFTTNIYTQLKNKTFTGNLSIVNNNKILFLREVKNGVNVVNTVTNSVNNSKESVNRISYAEKKCTEKELKACVNSKYENMNFVELSLCIYGLPECYVGVWAICGWEVCIEPALSKNVRYR
jgi:hypothetical protein